MMNIPSVLKLIVTVFFLSILSAQVHALTPDQVFDKVKDSIVVVKTLNAQGKVKGFGSGVLISASRVATNCHVVEGGASYQVGRGKELAFATLYAEDRDKDICILDILDTSGKRDLIAEMRGEVPKGITGKPAQLGKAAGLKVGVPVYAVGAPQGLELSLSDGIVAQLRGGPPPFIQTTAAISPGSSGGGLFDREGRLVGLTTFFITDGQSLNFAMPVEWIGEIKPGRKTVAKGHSQAEWLKQALALTQIKDWQGLIDWCRKWLKSEPKNADAWCGLGIAYQELKRNDDAVEAYRQALRITSDDAYVWGRLGRAYFDLKRYDDAIDANRQVVRITSDDADAWCGLGFTYATLNRYDDAIAAFREALRVEPKNTDAWCGLGLAYSAFNRYNDAIAAYRAALQINPGGTGAWYSLALTYDLSGNRSAALEAIKELRRLDPAQADELFNLIVPR